MVDGSSLEGSERCVELCCSIGLTLDKDCSSDGSNGLRALDGDDILALLLVVDFLQDDKYKPVDINYSLSKLGLFMKSTFHVFNYCTRIRLERKNDVVFQLKSKYKNDPASF